ncbi:hypothetical protein [Streptomyces hokutonensis]|uniref:hypothetical protein n=1 Tax=Streptomyces hokutonensis TaxID=1306990 RepID=UPI0036C7D27D
MSVTRQYVLATYRARRLGEVPLPLTPSAHDWRTARGGATCGSARSSRSARPRPAAGDRWRRWLHRRRPRPTC